MLEGAPESLAADLLSFIPILKSAADLDDRLATVRRNVDREGFLAFVADFRSRIESLQIGEVRLCHLQLRAPGPSKLVRNGIGIHPLPSVRLKRV